MSNMDGNTECVHIVVFPCEKCELAYTNRPLLDIHMKDKHQEDYLKYMEGEKPGMKIQLKLNITDISNVTEPRVNKCDMHICKICGLAFKSRLSPLNVPSNYTESQHIKRDLKQKLLETKRQKIGSSSSSKDNFFQCGQCDKSFICHSKLHRHLQTHTRKNEQMKNNVCDKVFSETSHLYTLLTSEKPFKCKECEESFGCSQQLFTHMRSHIKEESSEFKCIQCGKSFSELSHLYTHITKSHSELLFVCEICDKSFLYSRELQTHMKLHDTVDISGENKPEGGQNDESDISCAFEGNQISHAYDNPHLGTKSGIDFISSDGVVHLPKTKRTHRLRPYKYKCDKCDESFRKSGDLKKHSRVHSKKESSCKCDTCGQNFKNKSGLQSHMKTHTKEESCQCDECGKNFDKRSSLHRHMKTHLREKPFQCTQCDKAYAEKYLLHRHMKTHAVDKSFTCHECGKGFKIIYYLRRHMKVHSGEKPFTCKECGKVFNSRSNLLSHGRVHTGEKPFLCNECGRRFSRSNTLREHMRVHTGEKPYKCKQCGRAFRQSGSLHVHQRWHTKGRSNLHAFRFKCGGCNRYISHHRIIFRSVQTDSGEEVFDCSECDCTFSQRTAYVAHMKSHTGQMFLPNCTHHKAIAVKSFICDVCGKSFASSLYRDLHHRLHSGESRHECPRCRKQFVNEMVLQGHIRTHTGEKPFVCSTCGRAFSLISNLSRHRKIHSEEKPFKCKSLVVKDSLQRRALKHT